MKKRILSFALVLCMVLTLLPVSAFAATSSIHTAHSIVRNEVTLSDIKIFNETEPNNDFEHPDFVRNNYNIYGTCTYSDKDFFFFTLTSDTTIVVYGGSEKAISYSVMKTDGNPLGSCATQLEPASEKYYGGFDLSLSAGEYYLVVSDNSETDTSSIAYYVSIDWETGHNHTFTTYEKAPTCEESGCTIHVCSCGRYYGTDFVNPLGHNYGEWTLTVSPTCTNKGEESRYCSRCEAYETREVTALDHDYVNGKCTRCGDMINPFVDVSEKAVYYDAVLWAYYHTPKQITAGVDTTHFNPFGNCTRGQVVTFLWRAAGCPEPTTDCPFVDVKSSSPYYKAIIWAAEQGITNGVDATHFAPNATVTRAQFVTFLWRYDGKPAAAGILDGFTDAASIAKPYQEAVAWAVGEEIAGGYSDGTFRPNATCTRWAVVLFMYRDLK